MPHTQILDDTCPCSIWHENSCIQTASTITDNWPVFLPNSVCCVFQNKAWPSTWRVPSKSTYKWTRLYMCVCFVLWATDPVLGHQGLHTHTHKHTEQYQTGSIRHLYLTLSGTLLSGLMQIGHMQLSWSPLPPHNPPTPPHTRQKVYYCWPQTCVAALLVEVMCHEGLTECHLHVRKAPPSVKLATDLHSSRVNTKLYSASTLFFFFTQDIILTT